MKDLKQKEVWKLIPGCGTYEVSSMGSVRNQRGMHLSIQEAKKRKSVILTLGVRKKFLVHRLVALAFLEKVDGKDFINHKDGNSLNNHFENLEWCTMEENFQHARDNKLWKSYTKTERHIQIIQETRKKLMYAKHVRSGEVSEYTSLKKCAECLGVKPSAVSRGIKNKSVVGNHLLSFDQNFIQSKNSKRYFSKHNNGNI